MNFQLENGVDMLNHLDAAQPTSATYLHAAGTGAPLSSVTNALSSHQLVNAARGQVTELSLNPITTRSPVVSAILSRLEQWNTQDVAQWLDSSQLGHLKPIFSQFDGLMLSALIVLKLEAPSYFFPSLEAKMHLNFMDVLALVQALKKLGF